MSGLPAPLPQPPAHRRLDAPDPLLHDGLRCVLRFVSPGADLPLPVPLPPEATTDGRYFRICSVVLDEGSLGSEPVVLVMDGPGGRPLHHRRRA